MADSPGHLWALVQAFMDAPRLGRVSQRDLATRLGVDKTAITQYKYARTFPPPEFLIALAEEIGTPYEVCLDAALMDGGYRGPRFLERREQVALAKMSGQLRATKRKPRRGA